MNQNSLVTIFFFTLLFTILYLAYLILSPFLKAIAWAAILAIIAYPLYAWLLQLLKGRSTLAALIVTLLMILVVAMPAFRMADFLSQEAIDLAKAVRSISDGEGFEEWKGSPWIGELLKLWEVVSEQLASFEIDLWQVVAQGAQYASGFIVSNVKSIAQDVFIFFVNFAIVVFSFFFFLRDGRDLCDRIRRLLPMDPQQQAHLFDNIVGSVLAVVHGALIVAIVQGFLAGLAYWVLDVPFSLLLGVATAFTALIPIGGSALVWFPTSLYFFIQGSFLKGALLFAWGAGIVAGIDNILKPLFIGARLRIPVLFLFFSILGGMALFGALGLILGPVIFALLAALLDLYTKEYVKV